MKKRSYLALKGDRHIFSLNFLKSLLAISPFIRHKLIEYLKRKNQGFFKKPLLYLGSIFVIFLVGILIFSPKLTVKPLSLKASSSLTADIAAKIPSQNLFAEPVKNISKEPLEMRLLQQNSIIGVVPPVMVSPQVLGSFIGSLDFEEDSRKSVIEYIVEPGDTLSSIATKFNISLETILWANDLSRNSVIRQGQKLIILPVSGVIYYVKKGDTLSVIAKTYNAKTEEVIAFNELSGEGDIFVGDILIIPNGKMPPLKQTSPAQTQIPLGSSYFICPHSACKISQGLHWYNAIDFDGKCGDPLYAAAAGTIQRIKYGWNGGMGNYLTILHPNGVVTTYGHISASLVNPGQEISQGQIIALMGGKPGVAEAGISTGCHIHFSVRGARNPFAK